MSVIDCTVSEPISNKTFNYYNFKASLAVARFLLKSKGLPFECYTWPYTDQN